MNATRTEKYLSLIRRFLDRQIEAAVFERQYLYAFKNERPGMSLAEFSALETLFTAVDAYCPDPALRSEEDIDEDRLREVAASTLTYLLTQEAGSVVF